MATEMANVLMANNGGTGLAELYVEVLDIKDVETSAPVFVLLEVGTTTFKANVRKQGEVAEAFRYTEKHLSVLYKESLVFTLVRRTDGVALARGSVSISRLKIGKKVDRYFELQTLIPEQKAVPKVRLAVELAGPLRWGFQVMQYAVNTYASSVDGGIDAAYSAGSTIWNNYTWSLLLPLTGVMAGSVPLLLIAVTVGLPIFLPLLLLAFVAGLALLGAAAVIGLSSRASRQKLQALADPVVSKLTTTSVGQELLYQTGPMPSPYRVIKTVAPTDMWGKLVASLIIDFIGSSSYALPLLGEATDVVWAPTQAMLMQAMYAESSPYAAYFGLIEELLPFTDIIPSATMAWVRENGSEVLRHVHTKVADAQTRAAARQASTNPPPVSN